MEIQTATAVKFSAPFKIKAPCSAVSVGSCFSDKAAAMLNYAGCKTLTSPTGTIYNPVSIAETFERAARGTEFTEKDFFLFNGKYCGFSHHGAFSNANLSAALENANRTLAEFSDALKNADIVLLTPASAAVYVWNSSGKIAANCHKVPAAEFTRRLLSYTETLNAIKQTFSDILAFNGKCRIIISLSPVRHYPGEAMLNARSKAILLAAINEAAENCGHVSYFPAYEIMNDELRDYRYYSDDLVHPSELAAKIIISRFFEAYFDNGEQLFLNADKLRRQSAHIQK